MLARDGWLKLNGDGQEEVRVMLLLLLLLSMTIIVGDVVVGLRVVVVVRVQMPWGQFKAGSITSRFKFKTAGSRTSRFKFKTAGSRTSRLKPAVPEPAAVNLRFFS